MPALAEKYRVYAIDTPGCGMSDPPLRQYTVEDYANCVVAFLDELGIKKVSLFGRHTGGTVALEVAASCPDRVHKLIVYGVPYWQETDEAFYGRLRHFPLREDGGHLQGVWEYINRLLRPGLFSKPYQDKALDIINREVLWMLMAGIRYHEGFVAIHLYDMMSRLPLIKAATLVMSGEQDAQLPALEPVAKGIPGARMLVVKGGSYFTPYDDPETLAQHIMGFLAPPTASGPGD